MLKVAARTDSGNGWGKGRRLSEAAVSLAPMPKPFGAELKRFVTETPWRFARTYAETWPHEYVVRNGENTAMIMVLAEHILEHGVDGRFYSQVRKYHHEDGKVYWIMDATAAGATLVNRCDASQTYEARLAAGTLPHARPRNRNT